MIAWAPTLRELGGHPCGDVVCKGDRSACATRAGAHRGDEWPTCPLRDALDDSSVAEVVSLDRIAEVAPLSPWPGQRPAWLVDALLYYRDERARARAFAARVEGGGDA